MATVPVAAPLVAVPAIAELAIVAVAVAVPLVRAVRPVGTLCIRTAGAIPVWTILIGAVRPVGARLLGARLLGAGSICPRRAVSAIRALGFGPGAPFGLSRTLGGGPVGPVPVWPLRLLGGRRGSWRAGLFGAVARTDARTGVRSALGARFSTPLPARLLLALTRAGGHVAALALRLASTFATARGVFARLRPVLSHDGQGRGGRHEEAGGCREHEERTFHDRDPRTPGSGGLNAH